MLAEALGNPAVQVDEESRLKTLDATPGARYVSILVAARSWSAKISACSNSLNRAALLPPFGLEKMSHLPTPQRSVLITCTRFFVLCPLPLRRVAGWLFDTVASKVHTCTPGDMTLHPPADRYRSSLPSHSLSEVHKSLTEIASFRSTPVLCLSSLLLSNTSLKQPDQCNCIHCGRSRNLRLSTADCVSSPRLLWPRQCLPSNIFPRNRDARMTHTSVTKSTTPPRYVLHTRRFQHEPSSRSSWKLSSA